VCIAGQRPAAGLAIVTFMPLDDIKLAVLIACAIVWTVIAGSLATSVSSWILVVGSGVLPALMMMWTWHPLMRTMPAIIRDARQ
jgi:hypothetical protein